MNPRALPSLLCALLVVLAGAPPVRADAPEAEDLRTLSYLPADAVWVMSSRVDSFATPYDALLKLIAEFAPPGEVDQALVPLHEWETTVGISLRDDLLGVLGGEAAFAISLDDLDRIAMTAMAGMESGDLDLSRVLGGVMAIVGVQDTDHFDASIGRLVSSLGGRLEVGQGGMHSLVFPRGDKEITALNYRYHQGFALFGFGEGALTDAVLRAETGKNLLAGSAYQDVFARLAPGPRTLGFVNLPKVQALLKKSKLIQMAIADNPEIKRLFERFIVNADWSAGMGWASYPVEGGTIQQSFAPMDMGAFSSAYLGIMAAVAVPNFLDAMDRGRQKRTLAEIRDIGAALDAYAVDHGSYPPGITEPTPVSGTENSLDHFLVPTYIASLPDKDGWGNPIVYRSDADGVTYLLSSYGKDGSPSEEVTSTYDADIHFANGMFLAGPEAEQP